MNKKERPLYLFALLLALNSIIIYKNLYYFVWIILTIILLIKYRFPQDKNYLKNSIIRITIISMFSYFIIIYALGFLVGYYKNIFNLSFIGIVKNLSKPIILIICQELVRHIYAKNCLKNKKPYYILTIIFIFLNILMEFNSGINNPEKLFIFVCTTVFPVIATQIVCSYLTYNISLVPGLMLRICTTSYIFIFPILPSLGNYLSSVIGLFLPIIIYFYTDKVVKYYDKNKIYIKNAQYSLIFVPAIIISIVIIILTSGLFKYQLVAIGSGSMEPIIYRGDAIVFQKENNLDNIKIGDIVAYKKDNIIVVHRVVGINTDKRTFRTKGDNNESIDNYIINESELLGIVNYKIKYIGLPTVYINELFNK